MTLPRLKAALAAVAATALVAGCAGGGAKLPPTVPATPEPTPETDAAPTALPAQPAPLRDGLLALSEGRYREAAAIFASRADLLTDPDEAADSLVRAAAALRAEGSTDGAVTHLRRASELAAPGSRTACQASFLLGLTQAEKGETERADRSFGTARASACGALLPYVLLEHAHALAAFDAEAASALEEVLLSDPLTPPDVRAEVVRDRLETDPGSEGPVPLSYRLATLLESTRDPGLLLSLASLALGGGEPDIAEAALAVILSSSPASREALPALGLLETLGRPADLTQQGIVYYLHGRLGDARWVLEQAAADSPEQIAVNRYYLAAAIDDAGDPASSIPLYDEVVAAAPNGPFAHRASYWAARAAEATGDTSAASARYAAAVRDYPFSSFADESRFRAGYVWLAAGDFARAAAAWAMDARSDPRTLYWRGRALEELGDYQAAAESYQQASAASALDFYASQARRRLAPQRPPESFGFRPLPARIPVDWAAVDGWASSLLGAAPDWTKRTAASELTALGLVPAARRAVNAAAEGAAPSAVLALVREASEAGLDSTAASLAARFLWSAGASPAAVPMAFLAALYPLPTPTLLEAEAQRADLDPLLLAALVRQESLWDPAAVSPAGARGLTQVMPATGEHIAAQLGLETFQPDDLFQPAVSLRFGAYYLHQQLARFNSAAPALAAYNAGPGNAARWAESTDPETDGAAFVERIPYRETHAYVRLVLEAYAAYRLLAAAPTP